MRTRPSPRRSLAFVLVGAVVLTACAGDEADTRADTYGVPTVENAIRASEWVLDAPASTPSISDASGPVTLAFTEEQVSGAGPCNTFTGSWSIYQDDIEIGPIASTLVSCGDPVDGAEAEYGAALAGVDRASFEDDDQERLVLSGDGIELFYDAFDADEIVDASWTVATLGADALTVESGTALVFTDDGDLAVQSSCSTRTTSWELDGDRLTVSRLTLTDDTCTGSDDPGAGVAAALDRVESAVITPATMILLGPDRELLLVARRATD